MKNRSLRQEVREYFDDTKAEELDTKRLLNNLRPAIQNKCSAIKSTKSDYMQTLLFIISSIAVALTGMVILLPDIFDLQNEFLQFVLGSVVILSAIIGCFAIIRNFTTEFSVMKLFRTRRVI